MRREVLIHRVGIVIVVHVMPTEEHLARRPPMHENERRHLPRSVFRLEKLSVNFSSIRSFENHLLRNDELRRRKVARQSLGRKWLRVRAVYARSVGQERIARS